MANGDGSWSQLMSNVRFRSRGLAPLGEREETIMIHQLRIYEIFEHNKAAFHERFRAHAARLMRQYGFNIVAMWEAQTDRRTEFVYLLVWPDEAAKSAAWAEFMADEEWTEIKRVTGAEHGKLVGAIEDRILVPTRYSPPMLHSTGYDSSAHKKAG
jgi:heme-degrading monooxygenase HmoA